MDTQTTTPTISGFKFHYIKLDFYQKARLKELLGNPARSTFTGWLNEPDTMKLASVEIVMKYLTTIFPGIQLQDLTKTH